ncbi:MAG: exopolyphosphatase [Planctomycetota bacterium]|nr:exopolyphosphatase [Planctomycetota bacterium]
MRAETKIEHAAAVDLGSNSFHMVVARMVRDELSIVDRLRDRVALADGLDAKKRLSDDVQERAIACLRRFGERLRGMSPTQVRAVGTSALRLARNSRAFLERAEEALGHKIEIVSGLEEARLIYLGVAHDLSDDVGRRLVVDIGGGSTECILGERFEPLRTDSLHMGCVNWSQRFFPGGAIGREAMSDARIAAGLEVQSLERAYRRLGWDECVGASGTILAIDEILRVNGWSEGGITAKGLRKLRKRLVELGQVEALTAIPGLASERAPVIAGGVAILTALFDGLEIEHMSTSQGALREGVLYDLLGRIRHEDVRDRTIRRFMERYAVDLEQAGRVQRTALALFEQTHQGFEIDHAMGTQFLSWASKLHEIGISIAYSGYHHHGAYIVGNAEMPGFSREDQQVLATLIEGQRRRFPPPRGVELPPVQQRATLRLCVLLRLSVLMARGRAESSLPKVTIEPRKSGYALSFPEGWLAERPLVQADLEQERQRLAPAGFDVDFS